MRRCSAAFDLLLWRARQPTRTRTRRGPTKLGCGLCTVVPLSTTGLPLVHSSKPVPGVHASQNVPRRERVSPADLTAVWGCHCPPQQLHSHSKGKRADIAEWSSALQLRANVRSFLLQLTGFRQEKALPCYRRKDKKVATLREVLYCANATKNQLVDGEDRSTGFLFKLFQWLSTLLGSFLSWSIYDR